MNCAAINKWRASLFNNRLITIYMTTPSFVVDSDKNTNQTGGCAKLLDKWVVAGNTLAATHY